MYEYLQVFRRSRYISLPRVSFPGGVFFALGRTASMRGDVERIVLTVGFSGKFKDFAGRCGAAEAQRELPCVKAI